MIQTLGTNPAANFTPSLSGASFSPSPLALPATYGSTVSSTLSVASGTTPNSAAPISWTNDSGGTIPPFSSVADIAAPAIVPRQNYGSFTNQNWPKISPCGNILAVLYDVAGSPGSYATGMTQNPQPVANAPPSVAPPTIAINGGSPITPTNMLIWGPYGVVEWALNTNDFRGIDDTDAGCVKTGSGWSEQTSDHSGLYYGGSYGYSPTASDYATYTFTGCTPGRYQVSASVQWDPSYTTHAQYLVQDGGTTVGTYAVDQTQTPSFDRAYQNIRFMDLGIVTMTGTTMTVTLSNAAGSGTLSADCVRIERIQDPVVSSGDTVTFSCGFGWIDSSQGYAGQLVDAPVTIETDTTWFAFDATRTRTLRCGYNTGWSNRAYFTEDYASYTKRSSGNFVTDAWQTEGGASATIADTPSGLYQIGDLVTLTGGTAFFEIFTPEQQNGMDAYAVLGGKPGTWTAKYTVPADAPNQTPTVQFIPNSTYFPNVGSSTVCGALTGPTTDPVTGKQMIQQSITINPVTPATNSSGSVHAFESVYPALQTDGPIIQLEVYGPEIDTTWTKLASPDLISRAGAASGFAALRWMDGLAINGTGANVFTLADFATNGRVASGRNLVERTVSISYDSVAPADVSSADTQDVRKWNAQNSGNIALVITTTAPLPSDVCTGQWYSVTGDSTDYSYSDGSAGTFQVNSVRIQVLDSTHLIMYQYTGYSNTSDPWLTISGVVAATGTLSVNQGSSMPILECVQVCNDAGVDLWLNTPHLLGGPFSINQDDSQVTALFDLVFTALDSSLKCYIEVSNEVWNTGFNLQYSFGRDASIYGAALYAADPSKAPIEAPFSASFFAYRSGQVHAPARASCVAGGRPATDVIRVVGAQMNFASNTTYHTVNYYKSAYAIAQGHEFDLLAIATYQNNADLGQADPIGSIAAFYDALDINGLVSHYAIPAQYLGLKATVASHQAYLAELPFSVGLCAYEGGPSDLAGQGNSAKYTSLNTDDYMLRTYGASRHPRMFRAELARLQATEDVGFLLEMRYTLHQCNGLGANISPSTGAFNWHDYVAVSQPAFNSDGSIPTGYSNANPADFTKLASAMGGARKYFASLSAPPAPPPPPPPPAPPRKQIGRPRRRLKKRLDFPLPTLAATNPNPQPIDESARVPGRI